MLLRYEKNLLTCFKVLLHDAIFLKLATKSVYVAICTFFIPLTREMFIFILVSLL